MIPLKKEIIIASLTNFEKQKNSTQKTYELLTMRNMQILQTQHEIKFIQFEDSSQRSSSRK